MTVRVLPFGGMVSSSKRGSGSLRTSKLYANSTKSLLLSNTGMARNKADNMVIHAEFVRIRGTTIITILRINKENNTKK